MNETELVETIADYLFLTKTEVKETIDYIIDKMAGRLKKGKRLYIRNFGSLARIKRKQRRLRNVATGKIIIVPEHWTIEFRPAPALKKKINPAPARKSGASKQDAE